MSKQTKNTIDLTPTWEQWLKTILLVLENGNEEGKKAAKEELLRMAKIADAYVSEHKK